MHEAPHFRTVYKFGILSTGHFGDMILQTDGRVGVYRHPNEFAYRISDGFLEFLSESGDITSRLKHVPEGNCFLMDGNELYLLPVVTLGPPPAKPRWPARVMINSIPKSGTYYMSRVMRDLGFVDTGLHAASDAFTDHRNIADALKHYDIRPRIRTCAARALTAIMRPGEFILAHLHTPEEWRAIRAQNTVIINMVRDLRNVLVSYFHFSKTKVKPAHEGARLSFALEPKAGFAVFLASIENNELERLRQNIETVLQSDGVVLNFENIEQDIWPRHTMMQLEDIQPGFGAAFVDAVRRNHNKATSTLSERRAHFQDYWSDEVEAFFQNTGFAALNERIVKLAAVR